MTVLLLGRVVLAHPRSDARAREREEGTTRWYSLWQPNSKFLAQHDLSQPNRGVEKSRGPRLRLPRAVQALLVYLRLGGLDLLSRPAKAPGISRGSCGIQVQNPGTCLYCTATCTYSQFQRCSATTSVQAQRPGPDSIDRAARQVGMHAVQPSRPAGLLLTRCWWPTPAGDSRDRDVLTWTGTDVRVSVAVHVPKRQPPLSSKRERPLANPELYRRQQFDSL
jgi:hypothetical protein